MKSLSVKTLFAAAAMSVVLPAAAAGQDLDQLLSGIKADIAAQRLASPAGNNALERIDTFRAQAPYDYRVVPLTYEWGEAYVVLANKAIDAREYDKAQSYLDRVWMVAALTPGLEEVQEKLDKLYTPSASAKVADKGPSKEELERQRQLAAAAEKEKAKVEAERKRRAEEEKRLEVAEQKRAEQERQRRQEEERQRRAEAEKAEKEAAAQRVAEAQKAAAGKAAEAKPVVKSAAVAPAAAPEPVRPVVPVAVSAPVRLPVPAENNSEVAQLWAAAAEDSAPLASYPVPADQLRDRKREIADVLEPVCKAIIDNDASVVVHTADKSDYRWLTVRLTLCLRRLDKEFRLRHSHKELADAEPFVTLHPAREVSLVRKISD